MFNRYSRTAMMSKVTVNGREECDMLQNGFELFRTLRPARFYRVQSTDLQRPDLLSIRLYGTSDFWWVLGKVNNIDDWWNDLHVDDVLKVPHVQDIEDWFMQARRKK